jgi:hypothetical protein
MYKMPVNITLANTVLKEKMADKDLLKESRVITSVYNSTTELTLL